MTAVWEQPGAAQGEKLWEAEQGRGGGRSERCSRLPGAHSSCRETEVTSRSSQSSEVMRNFPRDQRALGRVCCNVGIEGYMETWKQGSAGREGRI